MNSLEKQRLPNYGCVLPGSTLVCEFKTPWMKNNPPTCGDLNMRLEPQLVYYLDSCPSCILAGKKNPATNASFPPSSGARAETFGQEREGSEEGKAGTCDRTSHCQQLRHDS